LKTKLAAPEGRYPKDSLDSGRREEQEIKVCHVGDLKIGLELHGANSTFPDRSLENKSYYLLSEQSGSMWTLQYKDAQNNSTYQLGTASVDEKGWLTVIVPALDTQNTPSIQLAREALACSTLTIVSKDVGERDYVQLRRPDECGPLVIEKFFANGQAWPRKNKVGDREPAKLPVPEVILPPNPWLFRLRPNDGTGVVLKGAAQGDSVVSISPAASEGSFGVNGARASNCNLRMQVDGIDFWNPRIDFNRNGLAPHDALTLSVDASDLVGVDGFANYSRFGRLNKAPAQAYAETNADRIPAAAWFPLSVIKVRDFEATQLSGVAEKTMSNLVQAWLPAGLFNGATARQKAMSAVFKDKTLDKPRSLKDWQNALLAFVKKTPEYVDWCGHLGPQPDQNKEAGEYKKWVEKKAIRDERLSAGPEKLREFVQHMHATYSDEDGKRKTAPLFAICKAIGELPRIEKDKQDTRALLERMLNADLVIEGEIIVWAPHLDKQPCVVATFAAGAGREPVVIGAYKGPPKSGPGDGVTDADVAAGDAAVPENPAAP
jgi:hypothetical protein